VENGEKVFPEHKLI